MDCSRTGEYAIQNNECMMDNMIHSVGSVGSCVVQPYGHLQWTAVCK